MRRHQWQAVGFLSGDGESFCVDVSRAEFQRLEGRRPRGYDRSRCNPGAYRAYPNYDPGYGHPDHAEFRGKRVRVTVLVEVLEEEQGG